MVNKVTLVGNVGRDPQLRRLESGAAVASFSLATSERYRGTDGEWRERTEWHEITLWRKLAERAEHALNKGMLVYLEGKLSTRSWQDKAGIERKRTEVVADYLRILDRKEAGSKPTKTEAPGESPADRPTEAVDPPGGISIGSGPSVANDSDESGLPF